METDAAPESAFVTMAKGIYDELDQKSLVRLDAMRKDMEASLSTVLVKAIDQVYGTRLKQLEDELRQTKELNAQFLALLKAMPTPQVVVPEGAIKLLISEKPRTTTKSIVYGTNGRAEKIIEVNGD